MDRDLRIIYMGTPEFAVPSLEALVESGKNVVAVITAPDKPSGRGLKVNESAVKVSAKKLGLPILQPTNLKDPAFQEELKGYQADLQIIVAFRMLPESIWNMPRIGSFNLHASLLPQYRGAAPINWAIINGEIETGVTTFFLKHEIDTGDIILQEKEPINAEDNVGDLYGRLMDRGSKLVVKSVDLISSGNYELKPQKESSSNKEAPKIFKETCQIDWSKTSKEVYDFIRGLSPYPASWTYFQDKTMKVFKTSISKDIIGNDFESDGKTYLKFKTADGSLSILELQLQGKKRMNVEDFLRGYRI